MTDRFVFRPHPSLQNVLNAFGTERGAEVVGRFAGEFVSLVDLLHHTQAAGSTSLVHEPDGNTVAFVNVPKGEFAHAATLIAQVNGFNLG